MTVHIYKWNSVFCRLPQQLVSFILFVINLFHLLLVPAKGTRAFRISIVTPSTLKFVQTTFLDFIHLVFLF